MNNTESLVLIPGLVCDKSVWEGQQTGLATDRTILIASHGLANSLADMADRVLATAPRRFALVGHSMGGRVALEIMVRAPERVARLALLDTGFERLPDGEAGALERAGRYRLREIARRDGMLAMGKDWARGMVHPARLADDILMGSIHSMVARAPLAQFEAQIEALLARPDRSELLPTISVPTLVLCGREDGWSRLAQHEDMARRIPGSRLVVVPECGHMSTMERPSQVTAALRAWLER